MPLYPLRHDIVFLRLSQARCLVGRHGRNVTAVAIDLEICVFGAEGAENCPNAPQDLATATNLYLENCEFGYRGRCVLYAPHDYVTVATIDLEFGDLVPRVLRILPNALQDLATSTSIGLKFCDVGIVGAACNADAPQGYVTADTIDREICDAGVESTEDFPNARRTSLLPPTSASRR